MNEKAVLTEEKYLLLERIKDIENTSALKDTLIDKQAQDLSEKNKSLEIKTKECDELKSQKIEIEKKHSDEIKNLKVELESKAIVEQERDSLKGENETFKKENSVLSGKIKIAEETIERMTQELQDSKITIHRIRRENFSLKKELTEEVQPYISAVEKINEEYLATIDSLNRRMPSDETLLYLKICQNDVILDNLYKANPNQSIYSRSQLRGNGFHTSLLRDKEFERGGLLTTNFHLTPEKEADKFRLTKK
ncbi:MAG: hypothetical protein EPN85_02750 [Bacteroidetes bacterium]|nr:MAG: hypothetical protein EPN85_02750 [Bacteroidota bacterium]